MYQEFRKTAPDFNGMDNFEYKIKWRPKIQAYVTKLDAIERKIDRIRFNEPGVRKILKALGIPLSKRYTTAVRGHYDHSPGFTSRPGYLTIRGHYVKKEILDGIIAALYEAGYDATIKNCSTSWPYAHADIMYNPFFEWKNK